MTLINLDVNGQSYQIETDPYENLMSVLRRDLHLRGCKRGCDYGGCGACTVIVSGKALYSCMMPVVRADGKKIITIEGLATGGKLHHLQIEFASRWAVQCGFCSPGMILSAKALLDRNIDPTEKEIREALVGNLCRCTGYAKIVEAIQRASVQMKREA